MPTDWVVYWLTRPFGLALIGAAVGGPFILWRVMLGPAFTEIGIKPLAFGYLCAALGLVLISFIACNIEFSSRAAGGLLQETQRWSIVPGWTFYVAILSLIFVLPLLGLVGVPVAAAFLKRRLLTPRNIAVFVLVLWLVLTILGWALPGNEWQRTHRLESFMMGAKDLLPGLLFIALPFMFAIHSRSRAYRLRWHDASEWERGANKAK